MAVESPLSKLPSNPQELNTHFQAGVPYRHIIIEDFLPGLVADEALKAFPDFSSPEWLHFKHVGESKLGQNRRHFIPEPLLTVIDALSSDTFLSWLETVTGIPGLRADDTLDGGGIHQSRAGGFLKIHADYTGHPTKKDWRRRINVLIYLNPIWEESWNGALEMWSRDMKSCEKSVLPLFNRCVVFETDETSYHGHPEPLACPDGVTRKSIALYYFTEDGGSGSDSATSYQALPSDGLFSRALIKADNFALAVYKTLKRRKLLSDNIVSEFFKKILGQK